MLSRLSLCGSSGFTRYLVKFQPISAITTSAASASSESTPAKKDAPSTPASTGTGHPPEYPPPTSKRDFVNFPKLVMKERSPPVRFGFIPDSWFQFFYPKTGYTGPYMFIFGSLTYIYSKEIFINEHNAMHLYSMLILLVFIHNKFGDAIGNAYNKLFDKEYKMLVDFQEDEKQFLKDEIAELKKVEQHQSYIAEILKGRTESIFLQMELAYRQRLVEAHKMVKNKLDCQAALQSVENRLLQRNLMDYVISNVMKSITPELEKNALQNCISDLNSLAARA